MIDPLKQDVSKECAAMTAYDQFEAASYDQVRFETKAGKLLHRREFGEVMRAAERVGKKASILEVGCGTGRLLVPLRQMGYQVDGIDASGPMLEQLKTKLLRRWPDLQLTIGEAADLPFPASSFDFTYAVRLLNQTAGAVYALTVVEEMCRITRPGGLILVEFRSYYRPRLGRGRGQTVRLKPGEVVARAELQGAAPVRRRGLFILSMQAFHRTPEPLLWLLDGLDRLLGATFPSLGSRCYIVFNKT